MVGAATSGHYTHFAICVARLTEVTSGIGPRQERARQQGPIADVASSLLFCVPLALVGRRHKRSCCTLPRPIVTRPAPLDATSAIGLCCWSRSAADGGNSSPANRTTDS